MSAQILSASGQLASRRNASSTLPALFAAVLLLGAVCPASARLVCARVLLPGLSEQETNPICIIASPGQGDAFLIVSLGGLREGLSVSNTLHRGWSIGYPGALAAEPFCQIRLRNSLEELPQGLQSTNWPLVNYLLNHRQGSPDEMQAAIWQLLGVPVPADDARFSPPSETTLNLIADAQANGAGFLPQSGQVLAVILDASPSGPPVFIEVLTTPDRMPHAGPDAFSVTQDNPLQLVPQQLLANDTDPDGDPLVLMDASLNSAQGGQITFHGGSLVYLPPQGFVGTDTFSYGLSAGVCGRAIGTVSVSVVARPNQLPVAMADDVATDEGVPLNFAANVLLANDSDPDGDVLHVFAVSPESVHGGIVQLDGTNVLYRPPAGFEGTDTFNYSISDGRGGFATATVTVTVRHVNHPPLAGVITVTTLVNTPVQIPLGQIMELSSDPDGDNVHLVGVTPNSYGGGLAVLSTASVRFTPRLAQLGTDTFNFTVEDTSGARATGAVNIVIVPANLSANAETPLHNPQTGLFEQRVTVFNNGTLTLAAFQLDITGLASNVVVWNASGTNNGIPYILYNRTLDPGTSATVRIEYFVPDRRPIHPVITLTPAPAAAPNPASGAGGIAIDRGYMDTRIPGEPRYVIEFASTPGRIYTIIYSDDMKTWNTAVPAVTASANRTQWYDDGPPKTDRKPAQGTRFYRVIESP